MGGSLFSFGFVLIGVQIVGKGVAGVDFDEVVDEQQLDRVGPVDRAVGVFGEEQGHHGELPGMFCAVFAAVAADGGCAAEDLFQFFGFQKEGQLFV